MIELFDDQGNRKYLTPEERDIYKNTVLSVDWLESEERTFALMLFDTGCRITEALSLTSGSIDFQTKSVTIETIKRRKKGVFRQIPISKQFLEKLDDVHSYRKMNKDPKNRKVKLWSFSRTTGWRIITRIMKDANISGIHATPKGLRHAFAIACIEKSIPLNLVSKWLGHSKIETTAIYANATGEVERNIISRLWA